MLTHQDVSEARQRLEAQNEALKEQVEVLRKEHYALEAQHREGRAAERAELASLREQLRGYTDLERELDSAIRSCADGPFGKTGEEGALPKPQTVDEAMLLGTTLASAPTSSQRRIQQSLILAQELQKRTREVSQLRGLLREAEGEASKLKEDLELSRKELQYSSEPQAYLIDALRAREREVQALRRDLRVKEGELEKSRQQVETSVTRQLQVEEDLKKLLSQRSHLEGLRAVLAQNGDCLALKEADQAPPARAEQRGRKPSQQPQEYGRRWKPKD